MLEIGSLLQDRYKVVAPVGKGGMGSVYLARDLRLRTDVALKETLYSDETYRRAFEQEAQILARLRHQHLPRVLDHFVESQGQFLVMEYIPGEDLGYQLSRHGQRFATPQAMPLILRWADQLLDALQYLHSRPVPVFHRDIKPKNLKYTSSYEIVLLDFGLARGGMTVTIDLDSAEARSGPEKRVYGFTPPYAPVEQMSDGEPDARGDLYALAATIYHLLTASLPPDARLRLTRLMNGQPDPLRPIRDVAPHVPVSVAELFQRALAVPIDSRPRSARAMREELVRLRGITPSASNARAVAGNGAGPLPPDGIATPPEVRPTRSPQPVPASPSSPTRPIGNPALTPSGNLLRTLVTGSAIRSVAFHPTAHRLAVGHDDQRVGIWRLDDYVQLASLVGHRSSVRCVRYAPDGVLLASASDDETVRIWRGDDGALLRQLRLPGSSIESLAFNTDGSLLAVGGWGKAIAICAVQPHRLTVEETLPAQFVQCLCFSPDGALLAAGDYNGSVYLWTVADYSPEAPLGGFAHVTYAVAFSPDGAWLAASSNRGVRIWRTADRKLVDQLQGHGGPVHSIAFSPDSRLLATASEDKSVRLWRTHDWTPLSLQLEHRAGVASVAFSPDGALLAAGSHDGRISLWSMAG
jgi:serine/threonine protein kinase